MEAADKSMVSEAMERTKGLGDTTASMPGTEAVNETVKEGMTLIERFYNGGNRARPGTLGPRRRAWRRAVLKHDATWVSPFAVPVCNLRQPSRKFHWSKIPSFFFRSR